jgi:hypothetical protein
MASVFHYSDQLPRSGNRLRIQSRVEVLVRRREILTVRVARLDQRHAGRYRRDLSAITVERADPDPRRDRRGLHPARRPLRELHPITILSTLPPAGVGAILALLVFNTEFDLIGLIAVMLLIGIVKKNAIMMSDFAIEAKRARNLSSYDAIFEASLLRFRPILMTTSAAILGAIPLALSFGNGGEIRRPLGLAIVGGLIISQLLTLYTMPVLYLYLDRLSDWLMRLRQRVIKRPPRQSGAPSVG